MSLLQKLTTRVEAILKYSNELCKPNPKYSKNEMDREFMHKRSSAFLLIEAFMIIVFSINIITGSGPIMYNIQGIIGSLGIVTVFFMSCQYHPEVFKTFFNVVLLMYGPHLIYHCEQGVLGAFISIQSHPTLVYLVTGSIYHFIFHTTVLTVLSNTFYHDLLAKSVLNSTPSNFVTSMNYYSHQTTLYSLAFTILTHQILQNAFHHVAVVDQKKDEFERQKNFVLGFSHELRNIINSMTGNISLASLERISDKAKELLCNAEVCSEVLLHLVNNILDSGKLEIDDLEITPAPTKIYDVLEKMWSVCSELIKRKKLVGRMKIQRDIPEVLMVDHYRLTQILLNLVSNAVKFTERGAVDVNVEWIADYTSISDRCFEPYPFNEENDQDEGLFEKSQALSMLNPNMTVLSASSKQIRRNPQSCISRATKGVLKITVSDTGVGMDKESMKKLFQKFCQVAQNSSQRKLGTGLGLFITKQLCEGMKGKIKVFSKLSKGSAFTLCLPIESVAEREAYSLINLDSSRALIAQRNLRSIVIDDEHFSRSILGNFLGKLGVNVVDQLENGLKGYQKFVGQMISQNSVDIITMDLDMPIMDGKIASQKIREYEAENNLRPCVLIIISANCSESEIKECVRKDGKIRANAFLKKPVSLDDLTKTIACSVTSSISRYNSI